MEKEKIYNIGLDIGVASVGWCVTDENSNILKKGNRHMWGARLFDEAKTAKDRRLFRESRRRIARRNERINILQSLFLEDMEKEYPNFFPMLRESYKVPEDKTISTSINGTKYNLFSDEKFNDHNYFKRFPTIYHLREYLIKETKQVDIRLVYLAIHHIIKYRGNFLYESDFADNIKEVGKSTNIINKYLKDNFEVDCKKNNEELCDILKNKSLSKANKKEELTKCFQYDKYSKSALENILKSFLGYKFSINKIFESAQEKNISFSDEIEAEEEIVNDLQDYAEVFYAMKNVYSWFTLQDILNGREYISEAFKNKYERYQEDLQYIKNIYKTYFKSEYNSMFRKEGESNYVAYNGKSGKKKIKKCGEEKFLSSLIKQVEKLPECFKDKEELLNRIKDNQFLAKLNTTKNGEIPQQLHRKELEKILENQSKYYPCLNENKDKILQLFSFRIPYYVGPLANGGNKKSEWAWVIRNSNERIKPWNFEEVVNIDDTAEEFIRRMTNKCTYLINEDVMPRQSILYSRFCVLNELNNIRINNKKISKDTKRAIINELFEKKKKVTKKLIEDLLKQDGIKTVKIDGLSDGINFTSNMTSYIDMKNIFGLVDDSNIDKCEKIIYWITIFEDKKILKKKIQKEYKDISSEQLNQILNLKYNGWSRLSKELLIGLKSYDGDSIMDKLELTHLNFMQIINKKEFGFKEQIEERLPKLENKITYNDVNQLPTSPANKRAIWQSINIVKEINKVMKAEPKNIYIEFARNEERNKEMKDSRAKQLMKKYTAIESQLDELKKYDHNVYKELKMHQNDKELGERLYLYFIQNGKCMYSGKALNIDELNKYEVDHIFPQSYIKDDSLDNKALVIREENQRKKDTLLLSEDIINKMSSWWKSLLDNGLITEKKFYRLIKRKVFETDEDRQRFVERQLVETRQITKYVTNLLNSQYKDTNIFSIRSELTSGFREKYKIYKLRNVNDLHHAVDAYIVSVIGNLIEKDWIGKDSFKYGKYLKDYLKNEKSKDEKYGIIIGFINNRVDVQKLKYTLNCKDFFVTRMLEELTGEFYNQTLYKAENNLKIPKKEDMDTNKYGGYSSENKAYCIIYTYMNAKNKQEYKLTGIPIKISYDIKNKKTTLEDYILKTKLKDESFSNFKILKTKILKNQEYLDENKEPMRLCSDSEIRTAKELIIDNEMMKILYLMNENKRLVTDVEVETVNKKIEEVYNYLLEKLNKEYKIFQNIYLKLIERKEEFNNLELDSKKQLVNGLLDLMRTGQGNLKAIGLGDRAGRMSGKKWGTNNLLEITFIDKSITGMYERRYRINGMENGSSK